MPWPLFVQRSGYSDSVSGAREGTKPCGAIACLFTLYGSESSFLSVFSCVASVAENFSVLRSNSSETSYITPMRSREIYQVAFLVPFSFAVRRSKLSATG